MPPLNEQRLIGEAEVSESDGEFIERKMSWDGEFIERKIIFIL